MVWGGRFATQALLAAILAAWFAAGVSAAADGPRYFHTPMLEIMQTDVYLTQTEHQETTIAYTGKGSDLRAGDFLTHADGVRILNGGLKAFLKNGDSEAIVPIIDEEDPQHGGNKLLGFVLVQIVSPRYLSTRRGDVVLDYDEGGPAPTLNLGNLVVGAGGVKSTSDPSYQPPPYGGGACITARDCNMYNGTCPGGKCSCLGPFTGTYCQLNRPESAAISMMLKKTQQRADSQNQGLAKPGAGPQKAAQGVDSFSLHRDGKPGAGGSSFPTTPTQPTAQVGAATRGSSATGMGTGNTAAAAASSPPTPGGGLPEGGQPVWRKKKIITKKKSEAADSDAAPPKPQHDWSRDDPQASSQASSSAGGAGREGGDPSREGTGPSDQSSEVTIEDLYGPGKAYPEPYTAGRLPSNIQQERYRRRFAREVFLYSVRYRSGPLGLVFDNKLADATVVEKVVKGQQSELSDVKEGDVLLAIDQYNVSTAPAKITQRVLSTLPWPRILVFQTRYAGEDPAIIQKKISSRTFNASIVFPPTLASQFAFRLAEWARDLQLFTATRPRLSGQSDFCPLYRVKTPSEDIFGCKVGEHEYRLPEAFDRIEEMSGYVDSTLETASPFLVLVMQEAKTRGVAVETRSLAVTKRGLCTFVEKSRTLAAAGAHLGLVVNTDDEMLDMPAGKENTDQSLTPLGLVRFSEGDYLHLAARTNEVWAVLSDNQGAEEDDRYSPACQRLVHIIEDVVDKWPHSVPALSVAQIKSNKAPDQTKLRGLTEEGGRMAMSGENGWVFFDYHLAMFGPQEVPLGPFRLVMAMPPFGCDPNAFTVRITGAVVAILRGGGCSFGIKVINAQKLGAKAVVIVNTDDKKTMRLMALPDEIPLIKIPCIMVSRRIQFYVEEQLRPYYPVGQHLVSIQPTGVFGDYEQRNSLKLPVRLQA